MNKLNGVLAIWLAVVLAVSGCSSSTPVVVQDEPMEALGPKNWAEVEHVDMDQYPDEPVEKNRQIQHDVPPQLMSSTADNGILEKVDGFRIQVFASEIRVDAARAEEELRQWIRSLSDGRRSILGLQNDPAIHSTYKQPYYRVRMGDFVTRAEAQPIVTALKSRFSGALIVPDVVEVRR